MKPELNKDNLKIALGNIYRTQYTEDLIRYLHTDIYVDTNDREQLYLSFFNWTISLDCLWTEDFYIKVYTWWKVNGNTDWVSKILSMDIDYEFNFECFIFDCQWFKTIIRSEDELLDNIIEILQSREKEWQFFNNEFMK